MTRMTGPDCAVMCNLINTHTNTHTQQVSLILPCEDQCEWHRMTRMTGPDCAVMCNLRKKNTRTHTHTHKNRLHGRRGKGKAESLREKLRQAPQKESGEILCDPCWNVHKPVVQNKWDDNTHTLPLARKVEMLGQAERRTRRG